jgi:hypothetical protein
MEEFHDWRGIEAKHCWQLRGGPSAAELAAALRTFLHLSAVLARRSSDGSQDLNNFDKDALKGKTNNA